MSIYTDYSYEIEEGLEFGFDILNLIGSIAIFIIFAFIISIVVSIVMIIALWKIFTKLGKQGWISLIPFYNTWVLFETQGIKGWWSLIPFANIIFMYIAYYKLAINFGRSSGFAILTIFFPYICLPILAFSKDKKKEENSTNNQNTNNVVPVMDASENNIQILNSAVGENVVSVTENNMNSEIVEQNVPNISLPTEQNNVVENNNTVLEQSVGLTNQNTISNICPTCGSQVNDGNVFCSNCGTKL